MAIARRFPIGHDQVFPYGAYLVGEVNPVSDYDRSTKDNKVQQIDQDSGLPLWSVEVLDADPEARKSSKTVTVKIPAKVQPVPPTNEGRFPFALVVFEGLSALPYVEDNGNFSKIAWSFRAAGMSAAKSTARAATDKAAS